MSKWNLIVDVVKCENCHNCSLATKDEHVGNDFPGYAAPQPLHGHEWIKIERRVRGEGSMVDAAYRPTMCNHCDNAPCLKVGGSDGAVRKRDDGIIIIDPQKAKGRRDLVESCPYGAIWWNDELQLPQIWIFDAHLLDQGWKEPRCQQSCPTGVYHALKLEDGEMQELARRENLQVLRPELGTKPRVYYRNLYRYTKNFLGGSVAVEVDGIDECVADARVALHKSGRLVAETVTNAFGDFKFDALDGRGEKYRVEITHVTLGSAATDVELNGSRYIDPIRLRRGPPPQGAGR
jgi:Fe-S-cluster-containing dehydrogenase component